MDDIFLGLGGDGSRQVLRLDRANRHGLIAGATGTGKTVTLQGLAESFSARGVPVFLADVKGDLSGIAMAGSPSFKHADKLEARAEELLEAVRKLGHYPREHEPSDDPDKECERVLPERLRQARSSELIQPDEAAELEELRWLARRERDAEQLEAPATSATPASGPEAGIPPLVQGAPYFLFQKNLNTASAAPICTPQPQISSGPSSAKISSVTARQGDREKTMDVNEAVNISIQTALANLSCTRVIRWMYEKSV